MLPPTLLVQTQEGTEPQAIKRAWETTDVLQWILDERGKQDEKWGEQNHEPFTWLAVLMEEVGEVNQDALKAFFDSPEHKNKHLAACREELIQVAAVAVAMIESIERGKWELSGLRVHGNW